jgi:hypothetical protein
MNSPANDINLRELNWVDFADSLRRGASQKQIAAYLHSSAAEKPDSIAAPAKASRQSGSAPRTASAPPLRRN